MRLVITSRNGKTFVDWLDYALLRDNVQHYLESGEPSPRFRAIHSVEAAVNGGTTAVDAARLRGELLAVQYALRNLDLRHGAVSVRTRAVLTDCPQQPQIRATTRAELAGWRLPAGAGPGSLLQHLQPALMTLLSATKTAVDGDQIYFEAQGQRPRFASTANSRAHRPLIKEIRGAPRRRVPGDLARGLTRTQDALGTPGTWAPPSTTTSTRRS